jgi:hypothetical protein
MFTAIFFSIPKKYGRLLPNRIAGRYSIFGNESIRTWFPATPTASVVSALLRGLPYRFAYSGIVIMFPLRIQFAGYQILGYFGKSG